jgi:hypothetical protein
VFRGTLSPVEFELSEKNLEEFLHRRVAKGVAGG